jgi:hypothetical protein
MLGKSWVAAQLAASQEVLISIELVLKNVINKATETMLKVEVKLEFN